jgi:glutamyl-Q tRNA(Asp) synthetase
LHFGSLIAALASFCDARAAGGEWLVRIEDVDTPRSRPGAESAIMRTLERYQFAWDGAVVRQSDRRAMYDSALATLAGRNAVYACVCSRRDLENAPIGATGERCYPGTCRGRGVTVAAGRRHALRVAVGADRVTFTDRLQGPQQQHLATDVGDFVVRRADGLHAYQLAVVVDDAEQGITAVVRGADLLVSTPRQIFLQRLLGLPALSYLHVPVAINRSGAKLSKQALAQRLPEDPLPALLAAWRFLDQPPPHAAPVSVTEFWTFAHAAWSPLQLPPVPMLPAPRQFDKAAGSA